jgi:hypothetical protein
MRNLLVCALVSACVPPPASVPMIPMAPRTETVETETAIDGVEIAATPVGAASWKLLVVNNTDGQISIAWDESSFVSSQGESAGRLIRGETRKMDIAKAQPPTPVPPHARASEVVLVEKLVESEEMESDYVGFKAKYGYVTKPLNDLIVPARKQRQATIRGGALNVTIQFPDGKKTWIGRVSK